MAADAPMPEIVVNVADLYATIGSLEVDRRALLQQVQIRDQRLVDLVDQLEDARRQLAAATGSAEGEAAAAVALRFSPVEHEEPPAPAEQD